MDGPPSPQRLGFVEAAGVGVIHRQELDVVGPGEPKGPGEV